jgi:methionyl aminopeptidase
MALIKSAAEISTLRKAGALLASVLTHARNQCHAGVTGIQLDGLIEHHIRDNAATPSFLGFEGYPNASCISVNNTVVHGIPTDYQFKQGDIIGIDVGLWLDGLCVDAAVTVPVGDVSSEATKLLTGTLEALEAGIAAIKPYQRVGRISSAVQSVAERENLGIVRALTGHGVGHAVHEAPEIPNCGHTSDGIILKPGMVLAIEPMFTLGRGEVLTEVDGWGIITADNTLSAHFEHTVLVTSKGSEVLTKRVAKGVEI